MKKILFVGDSLIAYFDWQRYFTAFECVNLGLPGQTVADCRGQVADMSRRHPRAELLVLMVGTNDLLNGDFAFPADYGRLLTDLHDRYPAAVIIVCGFLPLSLSWVPREAIIRLNDLLQGLALQDWAVYLDIWTPFLVDGPVACFVEDGVHLSAEGYRRWSAALARQLDSLAR